MKLYPGEYALAVVFVRDLRADSDVIMDRLGQVPLGDAAADDSELIEQFRLELQEACDEYGLPAGRFEIVPAIKRGV